MNATTTTLQAWAVSFGGVSIPFASHAEAKRFIKDGKKRVANRRGMFPAKIIRVIVDTGQESVQ